jgi:WD repeat-containing protein 90
MLQDKLIGKRVLAITGTVPAANYVQLPKHRSQSLGLHGRYLYMQVR